MYISAFSLEFQKLFTRTFFSHKRSEQFWKQNTFFYKWPFPSFAFLAYYSTSYREVEVATWLKEQSMNTYRVFKNEKKRYSRSRILRFQKRFSTTHFLYRLLDGKKTTHSKFSVPGLREIHRNLKQEKNFDSRESFFRKSPFCTSSCISPGFGGPWDKL